MSELTKNQKREKQIADFLKIKLNFNGHEFTYLDYEQISRTWGLFPIYEYPAIIIQIIIDKIKGMGYVVEQTNWPDGDCEVDFWDTDGCLWIVTGRKESNLCALIEAVEQLMESIK